MQILLLNANPVVSRLLVLCTRDDNTLLNEVTSAEAVEEYNYDVVFVDEASYDRGVADLLVKLGRAKKVFISYRSDDMRGFDVTIKKPFLPSQVTDIIKDVGVSEALIVEEVEVSIPVELEEHIQYDENEVVASEKHEDTVAPTVLDGDEIEKIKVLLDMDDNSDIIEEALSEDEIEERKVALIKEQLIADGLEIVEEDEIVADLSIDLDGTLTALSEVKAKKTKKSNGKKQKNKFQSKKIKFTQANMERIEDAVEMAMATMTKKQMKKLLKGNEIEISIKLEDKD